jgi:3-phosphoshikimate 1-carboxyvinyltransferase
MGLSLSHEKCTITVTDAYESKSYVDLSVQALKEYGIDVSFKDRTYYIPDAHYQSRDMIIEGDWSQAAFFAVLAAIKGNIECLNMDLDSLQGDKVIVKILKQAGAKVEGNRFSNHQLSPQTIDLQNCPDLGPILFVLAAYTEGMTTITHCQRLRIKESDRIQAMEAELKKWGVDIESTEDTVIIKGKSSYKKDETVYIEGHNDHRIVMAMTVFGLCADSPCIIEGVEAITKSYPNFFEDIQKVNGKIEGGKI